MRTIIWSLIVLLFTLMLASTSIKAQENQEKNKQKEQLKKQQQKELEQQKKQQKELDSITEEAQSQYDEELKALIKEQKKAQVEAAELEDALKRTSGESDFYRYRAVRPTRASAWTYSGSDQFLFGSGDNTTFSISKHLKNTYTFSNDFEYEVPGNVAGLYFDFGAELETGSLKLTITKPDGKVFQTLSVSPIANVDWNKRLNIKDTESTQYSGTWKITISTKEAKGYYELKINSN